MLRINSNLSTFINVITETPPKGQSDASHTDRVPLEVHGRSKKLNALAFSPGIGIYLPKGLAEKKEKRGQELKEVC
jgi:hypothetical protein